MKKVSNSTKDKRILARIIKKIAQEKRDLHKAEEKYDPHDDWHWNDH